MFTDHDPDAGRARWLRSPSGPKATTSNEVPASVIEFSNLVMLAVATTAVFLLAVAYDSRRRDDNPWV